MGIYSDIDVVRILQKGNSSERNDVIKQLYEKCYSIVMNFVFKNSGSKDDCEEVFQQTMEVFYNQIQRNKFNGKSSISTYFCAIAKNLWYVQLRKRKQIQVALDPDLHIADPEPSSVNDNLKLFYSLFEQLGEDCRKILKFFYFDKLTMADMVSEFDSLKSEQSVRTKKYRCFKQLVEIFSKNKVTKNSFI